MEMECVSCGTVGKMPCSVCAAHQEMNTAPCPYGCGKMYRECDSLCLIDREKGQLCPGGCGNTRKHCDCPDEERVYHLSVWRRGEHVSRRIVTIPDEPAWATVDGLDIARRILASTPDLIETDEYSITAPGNDTATTLETDTIRSLRRRLAGPIKAHGIIFDVTVPPVPVPLHRVMTVMSEEEIVHYHRQEGGAFVAAEVRHPLSHTAFEWRGWYNASGSMMLLDSTAPGVTVLVFESPPTDKGKQHASCAS